MKKLILFLFVFLTACWGPTAGTASDPNVDLALAAARITSTAQAFEMQVVGWTVTAQSWTPTASLTPAPTSTPTISPTPTINVTGTLIVEQMIADIEDIHLQTESRRATNFLFSLSPYVLGFIVLFGAVMLLIVLAMRLSHVPTPIHESGKPHPMLNVIDASWSDIDKATNGAMNLTKKFIALLPPITPDRQDAVTSRAQLVDMKTRTKVTTAALNKLLSDHGLNKPQLEATNSSQPLLAVDDDLNLPLPPWEFILQWDGVSSKPLGSGKQGLITAKAASPHILVAGKSGSGKTRYMLRPLTAASLAKQEIVINLGYSQSGFGVFDSHPNYHNANIVDPNEVVECLARVYDELQERKILIGGMDREWEHWNDGQPPRPFVTLLMDEIENLSEDLFRDYDHGADLCKELWSYMSRIAKEGRKTGISFIGALQDGTSKSIDLRFRRNCTLVALQLGDVSHSNSFIGASGAERLTVGHFMARTDALWIGGGFEPSDPDIVQYLSKHPAQQAEKPKWIDAVSHDVRSLPAAEPTAQNEVTYRPAPESKPKFSAEIIELAEKVRPQWTPKMSKSKIALFLFDRPYGGDLQLKVNKIIEYLTSTTTTAQNMPQSGVLEPFAG